MAPETDILPGLGAGPEALRLEAVTKYYPSPDGRSVSRAVDGISFSLARGTALGILGESGSGKSTTARLLLGLIKPTAGKILQGGRELSALSAAEGRRARQRVQFVSQDPYASFDPRYTIRKIVQEGLDIHGIPRSEWSGRIERIFANVGLDPDRLSSYPHHLSGGQLQRVSLARSLVLEPELLILDEPLSALDLSTQEQVLELLLSLRSSTNCDYVFISHDIAVTAMFCDFIAVMRSGRIVELARRDIIARQARHPYTQALVDSCLDLAVRDQTSQPVTSKQTDQPDTAQILRQVGTDHWVAI